MNIAFQTVDLRELCEQIEHAERRYGKVFSRSLNSVVADIMAAPNAADLPVAEFLNPSSTSPAMIKLKIMHTGSMLLVSNHARDREAPKAPVLWSKVTYIRVSEVTDK